VSAVRCPRCHREAPELTAFCAGCGAPLLLKDEAPAVPVDAPLELDRRSRAPGARGRGVPPVDLPGPAGSGPPPPHAPPPPGPRADALAEVERSHWDLGPIAAAAAAARGEPAPGAAAAPPRDPAVAATARNLAVPPLPFEVSEPGLPAGGSATRPPVAKPPAAAAEAVPAASATASTSTTTSTSTSTTLAATPGATPTAIPARLPADLLDDDLPEPEVDALEVHVARAEPWRRIVAWVVDGVPFLAAGGAAAFLLLREAAAARGGSPRALEEVIDLVSSERVIALSIAGAVALALATYATLAHALGGATLGKRLVRIRVVGPDGGPPSPARSAIRSALAVVSAALLGLGFLLALFTRTGRALHDVLARTWVVKAP
jgi:uncharacterized RDD family membrane protein YckC